MPVFGSPAVFVGDFNSHHQQWGYDHNDNNGNILVDWMLLENIDLIHNVKDRGTFHSARHHRDYCPDLCLRDSSRNDNCIQRVVLGNFVRSQHRPVLISYGLMIPIAYSIPKPR